MVELNGVKLAENNDEFIQSLFESGGTCAGYIKRNKNSISIFDHQKRKVGIINQHGVLASARKLPNGRYWYSYGTPEIIGKFVSYSEKVLQCQNLLKG